MAVPEQIPVVNYVADGIVKKFDVPFEYDQQSDLHVYVDGAEPTIDKYYFDGNAFNFYIAPTSDQDVKIKRITPKERDTDYNLHTNTVRPRALNTDFDRLWYVLQEVFSDVGGLSQTVQDEIIARIQGDEDLLNQLTAEISARMLGDEAVTEDLKNYVNQVVGAIINDPDFDGIDAKNVNDASGETQQQVNYNGGSKWHSRVGGYKLNERVVLSNGDIVKSTIDGNTNDPNVDMTGWVNHEEAQRIINNKNIGRFLSSFGAIPDDPAYAEFNEQCLFTAMQSGDVIVDGYYHIKPTTTRLINFPVSIYSRSLDDKGSLNFTSIISGGWLAFGSIDYFKIDGVRVISPIGVAGALTTVQSDTSLIDLFQLTNNYFSMDARFFYANYSTTVDPTVTRYGINNFKVNSNEFDKPRAWIFVTNMPHQLFEFKHNTLSNMSALFLNISRGSHSLPDKLKSVMKRAEIEYNTVINDDDFFATGNVVGGYCTPLLYEGGGHCNYRFNHVEGIKTIEDVAVYDCYINTGSLDSFKNTWKNNIGMFSGKTHNMLMKSKGTARSSYRNNKYIVERDFIERHGAQAVGWVQLYEVDGFAASNRNRFEAVDNEIDVYEIIGQTVASPLLSLIFKSNKVKAKNMTTLLFNVKRNDPAFTDFSNAVIDVSDNEFDAESCGKEISFRGSLISGWGLLRLDTPSELGIHKDLKVNGNTVRLGGVYKAFDFITGLEANKVEAKGNTLIANSVQVGATFAPFRYTNPNYTLDGDFRGNKVFLLNGSTMAATGVSFNLPASPTKLDIAVNGLFGGWYTNINMPTTKSVNALVTLDHLTNSLIYNASSRFLLSPTGITYTDLAGVQQTAAYPTSGTTNISMKCEQSSAINNVVPSISVTLRAAGSTVSINFGVTGLVAGTTLGEYKLKLETFA